MTMDRFDSRELARQKNRARKAFLKKAKVGLDASRKMSLEEMAQFCNEDALNSALDRRCAERQAQKDLLLVYRAARRVLSAEQITSILGEAEQARTTRGQQHRYIRSLRRNYQEFSEQLLAEIRQVLLSEGDEE